MGASERIHLELRPGEVPKHERVQIIKQVPKPVVKKVTKHVEKPIVQAPLKTAFASLRGR